MFRFENLITAVAYAVPPRAKTRSKIKAFLKKPLFFFLLFLGRLEEGGRVEEGGCVLRDCDVRELWVEFPCVYVFLDVVF
ncbi:MAG: hypothetical protein RR614_02660 [Eubacterium sp.]